MTATTKPVPDGLDVRWFDENAPDGSKVVDPDEFARCLDSTAGVLWAHVDVTGAAGDSDCLDWITTHFMAPEAGGPADLAAHKVARMGEDREPRRRSKVVELGGIDLLILHAARAGAERLDVEEVDVLSADHWVVTIRRTHPAGPVFDLADARARLTEAHSRIGSAGVRGVGVEAVLDSIVDGFLDVCDGVEDDISSDVEDQIYSADAAAAGHTDRQLYATINRLRRTLLDLRKIVSPMREVVASILRNRDEIADHTVVWQFEDIHERLWRVIDLVETQRDVLTGAYGAQLALVSNRMNRVMKLMTSWGAILLGASLIAGIFGMNVAVPGGDANFGGPRWSLPVILGGMLVMTVLLYTYFKRKDWL